ncbi:reverse transcriptase domain-containing protein [Bacillus toyonensis]|uniref:reverse transcriptase domain-containing protein n=1 Tax=Bacillus toyonensis TaxID=155322 RepID=UPI002540AE88|nr:reverse transcriptase domain-containing protein [Bacillus toyonensis]WIG40340.1 reverse transcriptase domain-containing protein [Bacillus toyonensis]
MSYFDAKVKLEAKDEDLTSKFRKLRNFKDISDLLEVTPTHLHYILYRKKKDSLYYQFDISKKNGSPRKIEAPCNSLKLLQQKLNYIISLMYKPKFVVHGYVNNKGIITNAKQHLKKNYVLNLDLKDFFSSINLGRIMGVLKSFFGISDTAAAILANICCHNNSLPQGAPTSPILSNMVCFQLDKELQALAKQSQCIYTRYADDITLSTKRKVFPTTIAYYNNEGLHLGKKILTIIKKNGFEINHSKTRLSNKHQHLGVTGITVNEKLNVQRTYIKKVRAILKCLELNDLDKAQKLFEKEYSKRYNNITKAPSIMSAVKGMIGYIGMVKGLNDDIFKKLARRYNKIAGTEVFSVDAEHLKFWTSHVYVVEIGYEDEEDFYPEDQGTGFFLQGVGFITNAHVVQKFDGAGFNAIYVNRSRYSQEKISASIVKTDPDRDIAILKVKGFEGDIGFKYSDDYYEGQKITLLGYPNHGGSDSLYICDGQIQQYRSHYMENKYNKKTGEMGLQQERIVISSRIVTGNSGGPVVNSDNRVIGIATKGFAEISPGSKDDSTQVSMIVKIKDVLDFLEEIRINETNAVSN